MNKLGKIVLSFAIVAATLMPASFAFAKSNYYTNIYGNSIHVPVKQRAPIGATAKCRDGTYSFSQSRRGTCSHHHGVAQWLN